MKDLPINLKPKYIERFTNKLEEGFENKSIMIGIGLTLPIFLLLAIIVLAVANVRRMKRKELKAKEYGINFRLANITSRMGLHETGTIIRTRLGDCGPKYPTMY